MFSIRPTINTLIKERHFLINTNIKTKLLYVRRKIKRLYNSPIPLQLWIGITYRCQCQCVHCCMGPYLNKNKSELTKKEIYNIVDTARSLGFLEICYFGGEPLLRSDIIDLIQYASIKGLLPSIYTNGILLTKEKVKELQKAGLYYCNVSLDSASPEHHDSLRKFKGCFNKAMDGIKYLMESGVKCDIWTYVSKDDVENNDLKDTKDLIELGRRINVNRVVILFPMASGNWICGVENILTQAEREKVRNLYNPPFVVLEFPSEETYCIAGRRMIYVNPQGDVSPCPTIPHFFGNIRKESLTIILEKLNSGFSASKEKGCGECVMNKEVFREKIGMK